MSRKLRILGLAFVAVLASSALVASAAQAVPTFEAESFPVTIHGTNTIEKEKFTTEAGTVECFSSFHGEITKTQHEKEPSTLTAHPTYTECRAFGFLSATVTTTGCNYVFHATEKTSLDNYKAHVDVVCEAGKSIKIVASTCSAEVKGQTGLTTAAIKDDTTATPKKDTTVTPNVAGIAYTVTNDGFLCPFNGTGAKTGGTYTSSEAVTITGQSPTVPATKIGIEVKGE